MFAIVAGEVDQRDWNVRLVNERAAYVEAVVSAAVVDEHDLVSARDREAFERANQFGNATCPVIDRNYDRQREARELCLQVCWLGLNHESGLAWQRRRGSSPRMEEPIPLAEKRFRSSSPACRAHRSGEGRS